MKKTISALLVLVLLVSAVPGFAIAANKSLTTEDYAYMDILTASDEVGYLILAARQVIIYGDQAWTVDGAVSIVRADGTVEALSEFSELYPDWDLPSAQPINLQFARDMARLRAENTTNTKTAVGSSVANATTVGNVLFNGNVSLVYPVGDISTGRFFSFNATGASIVTVALTLPVNQTVNIGYSNEDTLKDLGWTPNLAIGDEYAELDTVSGVRYSVRASTFGNPGTGRLQVREIS